MLLAIGFDLCDCLDCQMVDGSVASLPNCYPADSSGSLFPLGGVTNMARSIAQEALRLAKVRVVNAGYLVSERQRSQTTIGPKVAMVARSGKLVAQNLTEVQASGPGKVWAGARSVGAGNDTSPKVYDDRFLGDGLLVRGSLVDRCDCLRAKIALLNRKLSHCPKDNHVKFRTLIDLIDKHSEQLSVLGAKVYAHEKLVKDKAQAIVEPFAFTKAYLRR